MTRWENKQLPGSFVPSLKCSNCDGPVKRRWEYLYVFTVTVIEGDEDDAYPWTYFHKHCSKKCMDANKAVVDSERVLGGLSPAVYTDETNKRLADLDRQKHRQRKDRERKWRAERRQEIAERKARREQDR